MKFYWLNVKAPYCLLFTLSMSDLRSHEAAFADIESSVFKVFTRIYPLFDLLNGFLLCHSSFQNVLILLDLLIQPPFQRIQLRYKLFGHFEPAIESLDSVSPLLGIIILSWIILFLSFDSLVELLNLQRQFVSFQIKLDDVSDFLYFFGDFGKLTGYVNWVEINEKVFDLGLLLLSQRGGL
jgi:hypothetical protein